jgi:hypothetical protein
MTSPAVLAFWQRANRRAMELSPDLAYAILRAFQILRDTLAPTELARIIRAGDIDVVFRDALSNPVLDRAFAPFGERLRSATEKQFKYFTRDLPKAGKVDGVVGVSFDVLNPKVIDAIRALDTKVIQNLQDDVRETVRAYVENGLRDGASPIEIARGLRNVIGLSPTQQEAVRNFRRMLEAGDRTALKRTLRDKRFDKTLERALGADGEGLTAPRVEAMTNAYRRKMLAFNAETNARTASLDAMKLGQRLSWQDAADNGIVDGDRLMKRWVGVMDDRERPEHVEMEGEEVAFDELFSNGEMVPGDSTYNCRCVAIYFQSRPE